MGYDYRPKLKTKEIIFNSEKIEEVKTALKTTNSNILYYPKDVAPKINLKGIRLYEVSFLNPEPLLILMLSILRLVKVS